MFRGFIGFLFTITMAAQAADKGSDGMVSIPSGTYVPLYAVKGQKIAVHGFLIDRYPVTNQEFLEFVQTHHQWKKSLVKKVFAEASYLALWKSDSALGENAQERSPVTDVSWFAASAFCESKGKLLPTTDQIEYLAFIDSKNPQVRKRLTEWYSEPNQKKLGFVGSTYKNEFGVYDLYGLIWEWTLDFNTAMVTGESRGDSALEKNLFCGNGAVGASNFKDYAAFMRFAYMSSLKATYSTPNLGFRCAKE